MHSEPPQNPNIAGAEPGAAAPNPNLANQPQLRFNCDTAQPAKSQPHQNARAPRSNPTRTTEATHRSRRPTPARPTPGGHSGGPGGRPPVKALRANGEAP